MRRLACMIHNINRKWTHFFLVGLTDISVGKKGTSASFEVFGSR